MPLLTLIRLARTFSMESVLNSADWYRALTLSERAALPEPIGEHTFDREKAEERARFWREQTGLAEDDLGAARLALHDLTPERFLRLLAESPESLRHRCPETPAWLFDLERIYRRPGVATVMPLGAAAKSPQAGFLELIAPLMADAYESLCRGIENLLAGRRSAPFETSGVAELLVGKLPDKLLFIVSQPLALELRIASLEERLPGETPQQRFQSFIDSLGDRDTAWKILGRYPVLARSVALHLEQWKSRSLEFLDRLLADFRELGHCFSPGRDPGSLVEIVSDLSDRHHGGRTVKFAGFASGLRVVYKPRSLAGEARFQDLLAWLNERGQAPDFRLLKTIDRGDYGWVEYVEQRPCNSRQGVTRFYRRQGAYLALLYALEASDFHYENLIACGEHPVLVDLETLLQPRISNAGNATDFVARTVLRTHLLPGTNPGRMGLDVSGLGSVRGQKVNLHDVDHPGTDRMQLMLRPAEVPGGDNLPALDSEEVGSWEFREDILRGFEEMYRLLERRRDDLLAPTGPLAPLVACEMRVLLRPTAVYGRLLVLACHPDAVQDALVRDRLFDKLWLGLRHHPMMARALGAELRDLADRDFPHFVTRPDSRDLWTSSGQCLEDFFQSSGSDCVRQRLEELGEEDLERQSYLVRESLRAIRPKGNADDVASVPLPVASRPAARERFLAAALSIGQRLERLAVNHDHDISWFHLAVSGEEQRHVEPVGSDLYHGLGGISLFLAHLGERTGEARFSSLASQVQEAARRRLEDFPDSLPGIGAFSGRGGWIYTLTHLGLLWRKPELLAEAQEEVPEVLDRLEADEAFDLIGGAAGAIVCLLALYRHRPAKAILEAAVACGEHLLRHAQHDPRGWGWRNPLGDDLPPLTGLGHGAAGSAWAMAALARKSGQQHFAEAAREALAYERSWFSPEKNNWPDLRTGHGDGENDHSFFHGWCHGAPGIGLGRLAMAGTLEDLSLEDEVRAAVSSSREEGFGASHCLCHGDLGNLDLLVQAGARLGDGELESEARRIAAGILTSIERGGPRCGMGEGGEPPGLMTGLAGIGYGLLRAANPRRVPSVLLLETPCL